MAWITKDNEEQYIKRMARHFRRTISEEELRKNIKGDHTILEDFVDWLEDGGVTTL